MSTPQELRDLHLLIEADFLNAHGERLDQWRNSAVAPSVLDKQMKVAAIAMRARAKILHEVLAASQAEAS
jgi:hypothetical protein